MIELITRSVKPNMYTYTATVYVTCQVAFMAANHPTAIYIHMLSGFI